MTLTADRVFEALTRENDPAGEPGEGGAWASDLADAEPLTASSVRALPTALDALMFPDETAAGVAQLSPSAELPPQPWLTRTWPAGTDNAPPSRSRSPRPR